MVSIAQIRRIAPSASGAIAGAIVSHWHMAEAAGINSPLRAAHFLARVAVETIGLTKLEEGLTYTSAARIRQVWPRRFRTDAQAAPFVRNARALANHVYNGRMGNAAGSDDGWTFRGGGMMQTTGREGYRKMGFEDNPGALRSPKTAFLTAVREWHNRKCNAMADRDDVVAICKAINGGTHGLDDQRKYLAKAKRIFVVERSPVYSVTLPLPGTSPPENDDHVRVYEPAEIEDVEPAALPADMLDLPHDETPVILNSAGIVAVQHRLRQLGYFEVGDPARPDATGELWGSRTTAAISALQKDRGLTVTGGMNVATQRALALDIPRPIPASRAEASAERVREVAPAAKDSWLATQWSKVTGFGAAILATISGVADYFPDANETLTAFRGVISDVSPLVWAGLVGGVSLAIYLRSKKASAEVVKDYQTGRLT